VCALNDDNSWNRARARQHLYSLSFMKLDPQRMLPSGSCFPQPQITLVSDFSDSKAGPIECTRNHASWSAAAFAQNEVPEHVTFPAPHRFHDRVSRDVLPTRRCIKRDPTAKSGLVVTAILSGKI
jgi:hypothetical protein